MKKDVGWSWRWKYLSSWSSYRTDGYYCPGISYFHNLLSCNNYTYRITSLSPDPDMANWSWYSRLYIVLVMLFCSRYIIWRHFQSLLIVIFDIGPDSTTFTWSTINSLTEKLISTEENVNYSFSFKMNLWSAVSLWLLIMISSRCQLPPLTLLF